MAAPGATIFGISGLDLTPAERDFLRAADPWGLILFSRNVESPEQLRRLTGDLRAALGRAAVVLVDQEGGRVQRLRGRAWHDWPNPLEQAGLARDPARAAWLRARIMAHELRAAGIDGNCAPTCDIAGPRTHPFLRSRCWGESAAAVIAQGAATIDGLLEGGVLPVIKHIPGHGRAEADSHHALPVVEAGAEELSQEDFAVFRALADAPMAMTAHVRYPALDPSRPATLSPAILGRVRREIGFQGLLMTDDIGMAALEGPMGARAAAALGAGCDVVLHCSGVMAEMEAVAAAAGPLRPAAAARAAAALAARRAPAQVDIDALEAEYRETLAPAVA